MCRSQCRLRTHGPDRPALVAGLDKCWLPWIVAIVLSVTTCSASPQSFQPTAVVGGKVIQDILEQCKRDGAQDGDECRLAAYGAATTVYVEGVDKLNRKAWGGTGSIVCQDVVLVAAHAVRPALGVGDGFRYGIELSVDIDRNPFAAGSGGYSVRVQKVVVHGRYVDEGVASSSSDLALIKLREPIRAPYRPADFIRTDSTRLVDGVPIAIIGFGESETSEPAPYRRRLKTLRPLDPAVQAGSTSGYNQKNINVSGGGCNGDSGGPGVVISDVIEQVGVTIEGDGRACERITSFARVKENRPELCRMFDRLGASCRNPFCDALPGR